MHDISLESYCQYGRSSVWSLLPNSTFVLPAVSLHSEIAEVHAHFYVNQMQLPDSDDSYCEVGSGIRDLSSGQNFNRKGKAVALWNTSGDYRFRLTPNTNGTHAARRGSCVESEMGW